jgi:predicted DNA-binding transcriptional regulator AlpA
MHRASLRGAGFHPQKESIMAMKPIPQHFDDLPASAQVPARTLAIILDVSEVTIWRWAKIGKLPRPRKPGGNTTRFNVGEVRIALAKLAA